MSIPKNIKKSHLLQAISEIDEKGVTYGARSKYYDLLFEEKKYPPKLVLSIANKYANGKELDRNSFTGGETTECFRVLRTNGFLVEPKEYFYFVIKFLEQANDSNSGLKVDEYSKSFRNTKVQVSFGQGGRSAIPWIAFLAGGQTVSKGIYPVFLYYKDQGILILAYGISETKAPEILWPFTEITVREYFQQHLSEKPKRYGDSMVFKSYEIDSNKDKFGLSSTTINTDLNELLTQYYDVLNELLTHTDYNEENVMFNYKSFYHDVRNSNLLFSELLIQRFIASLQAKRFVILTGLAGSGKTQLAISFAKWICKSEEQICLVPVGADWVNREPLLGFQDVINEGHYVKPENGALDLLIAAAKNPQEPYFLILDEMNLSHVERYFSDFLSVLESGENICLHSQHKIVDIPKELSLPANLFIIGTVNIDETTYMFSPKVLDRGNVIEFRVSKDNLREFLYGQDQQLKKDFYKKGVNTATSFLTQSVVMGLSDDDKEKINSNLLSFFDDLQSVGAEFGYRTAAEVVRLIDRLLAMEVDIFKAIDIAIVQKLLPKLHGSRRKLSPVLEKLKKLCIAKEEESTGGNQDTIQFPISYEKIQRMEDRAIQDGFTSFAEA